MTLMLPRCFGVHGVLTWDNPGVFQSAGQSVSGGEDLDRRTDGGGGWRAVMQLNVTNAQQWQTWEALLLKFNQDRRVIVPRVNRWLTADFVTGPVLNIPFSDDTVFDDGAGWENGAAGGIATLQADASWRDVEISVTLPAGAALRGGEPLSITGPTWSTRLYGVVAILDVDPDVGGDTVRIWIDPPLREDVAAGTDVDFQAPRCFMRAMPAAQNTRPPDQRSRFGAVEMAFVESWRMGSS